jgi:hypothetical protein
MQIMPGVTLTLRAWVVLAFSAHGSVAFQDALDSGRASMANRRPDPPNI